MRASPLFEINDYNERFSSRRRHIIVLAPQLTSAAAIFHELMNGQKSQMLQNVIFYELCFKIGSVF
jgi:hypothetical protein